MDAAQVSTAFKRRRQENIGQISGQSLAGDPFAQTQYVGVVVRPAGTGVEFAGGQSGPDAVYAVGRHAHTDAGAADQNAQRIFALKKSVGYKPGSVRIISTGVGSGAKIVNLVPLAD